MRVNLRGGKTGVSEQGLNAAQIGTGIEQERRATVTKLMRAERNRNRSVPQVAFENEPDRTRGNTAPGFVNEKCTGVYSRLCPITGVRFQGRCANRTNALLSAFTQNSHRLGVEVEIAYVE